MTRNSSRKVLLIGWDGADWRTINPLIEKGQMPNLERFINGGVMGNVASLTPMLSPILWTSIATGKHADKHQILGFAEPDGTGGIRPVTSTSRKCRAIWNMLADQGFKCGVVNWFASHPAEKINGFVVTDRYPHAVGPPNKEWPVPEHSIHPLNLVDDLGACRVHPAATTPIQILPFIPKLAELDAAKDQNLHELRSLLAKCATVHSAATWLMHTQPWDFMAIYYDAIDRFGHSFMEYNPPKMEHISDADFERYQHVMTGCYRFHDMMLGRLVELAGPETTIILLSDHGFHSERLRPKGSSKIQSGRPVAWHRLHGILAINGPGIKKDQRVYGASLLDITPTILAMFGSPVAKDMDGHVLRQVFEAGSPAVEVIETFEQPESAQPTDQTIEDPWVLHAMTSHLAELGYIETGNADEVVLDRARNLGQVLASTGRPKEAIEEYESVLAKKPDDKACKIAIASCRLQLGQLDECERTVRDILTEKDDAPLAHLYSGIIAFRRGDSEKALDFLKKAEKANPRLPELHCQIGNVYLHRKRWRDAERAFRKALAIDGDSAEAHDGLGVAYRWQNRFEEAVLEHMRSIGLIHHRPSTHIHLGLALAKIGQIDWAIQAFGVAIEQNPNDPFSHQCLAQLFENAKRDPVVAARHREAARSLSERRGRIPKPTS